MKVEFTKNNEEDNPELEKPISKDSELKNILVDYVGNKVKPEDEEVTVAMIAETLAEEFPEFLMAVAEENWIRGYQQALTDVSIGEKLHRQEQENDA